MYYTVALWSETAHDCLASPKTFPIVPDCIQSLQKSGLLREADLSSMLSLALALTGGGGEEAERHIERERQRDRDRGRERQKDGECMSESTGAVLAPPQKKSSLVKYGVKLTSTGQTFYTRLQMYYHTFCLEDGEKE